VRVHKVPGGGDGLAVRGRRLVMRRESYGASGGIEVFGTCEYERAGKLAGFVRMRALGEGSSS